MNALWLERFAVYRVSPLAAPSAAALLEVKDARRAHVLKRYGRPIAYASYLSCENIEQTLLTEARNAKEFWRGYRALLPEWCGDFNRKPRGTDAVNKLLDIGYHHLAGVVEKIIVAKDISPSLGLIHRAHRAQSKPLVYDLMELFRADVVDFPLLRFLRLKKKPLAAPGDAIAHFLATANAVRDKKHYLRDFKQCHRYEYYMDLQVTKFIKAVNHNEIFEPLALPRRHDSRCACLKDAPELTGTLEPSILKGE